MNTNTIQPTYAELIKWLRVTVVGDDAKRFRESQIKLYGRNNIGTGMGQAQAAKMNLAIKAGERAEKELIRVGYYAPDGSYQNSTNPIFRSAAKWFESNYL